MEPTSLPMIGGLGADDRRMQELAIILAQDYPDAEPEPEPQLDYLWLNSLISVCRNVLHYRDIKCADYVAQARQHYYYCHQKFHYHYRELQDCQAYSYLLDRQKEKLLASGSPDEAKLKEIDRQHTLNDNDMAPLKKKLEQSAKNRKEATAWFSKTKADFIRTEMPRLVYCAKHLYAKYAAKEGSVHSRYKFLKQGPLTLLLGTCTSASSGTDGAIHVNGVAGASGVDRAFHVNGVAGASGTDRAIHVNGVAGASGANGVVHVNGVAEASGVDRTIHVNGIPRTSGADRAIYMNGVAGAPGVDRAIYVNGTARASGADGANNLNGAAGAAGGEFS